MVFKGIEKGDKDLRHFTFDEDDVVVKGGVHYYKVNYGKNKLEGEYAEDEIGYVACDKIIPLGGKRPSKIPGKEKEVVSQEAETPTTPTEMTQDGLKGRKPRTTRATKTNANMEISGAFSGPGIFEYKVEEIKAAKIKELEKQLNEKGQEGWELCGFDTNKSLFGEIHIVAVFKRRRG